MYFRISLLSISIIDVPPFSISTERQLGIKDIQFLLHTKKSQQMGENYHWNGDETFTGSTMTYYHVDIEFILSYLFICSGYLSICMNKLSTPESKKASCMLVDGKHIDI